jgi:hypothetical protein
MMRFRSYEIVYRHHFRALQAVPALEAERDSIPAQPALGTYCRAPDLSLPG